MARLTRPRRSEPSTKQVDWDDKAEPLPPGTVVQGTWNGFAIDGTVAHYNVQYLRPGQAFPVRFNNGVTTHRFRHELEVLDLEVSDDTSRPAVPAAR